MSYISILTWTSSRLSFVHTSQCRGNPSKPSRQRDEAVRSAGLQLQLRRPAHGARQRHHLASQQAPPPTAASDSRARRHRGGGDAGSLEYGFRVIALLAPSSRQWL